MILFKNLSTLEFELFRRYYYRNYIINLRLKYLFGPHFRSVCCEWSSFLQNV